MISHLVFICCHRLKLKAEVHSTDLSLVSMSVGLELAGRFEQYDNNKALTDHGDQRVITAGANLYFKGHNLKLQTNYINRSETAGATLDNDALLIGVAAAL